MVRQPRVFAAHVFISHSHRPHGDCSRARRFAALLPATTGPTTATMTICYLPPLLYVLPRTRGRNRFRSISSDSTDGVPFRMQLLWAPRRAAEAGGLVVRVRQRHGIKRARTLTANKSCCRRRWRNKRQRSVLLSLLMQVSRFEQTAIATTTTAVTTTCTSPRPVDVSRAYDVTARNNTNCKHDNDALLLYIIRSPTKRPGTDYRARTSNRHAQCKFSLCNWSIDIIRKSELKNLRD